MAWLSEDISFTDALRAVEQGSSHELAEALNQCRPYLENLLSFKGKDATQRSQLDGANFQHRGRELTDYDKNIVRQLSDALDLSEFDCVDLLIEVHKQQRDLTAECAAGLYHKERQSLLLILVRLLQMYIGYYPCSSAAGEEHAEAMLRHLTSPDTGRQTLTSKLCEIAKDGKMPGSVLGITTIVDENGFSVSRHAAVAEERALACQAIFLLATACGSNLRMSPSDAVAALDLLKQLEAAQRDEHIAQQDGINVLLALITALTPKWSAEAAADADQRFAALVTDASLRDAVGSLPKGSCFLSIVQVAYSQAVVVCHDGGSAANVNQALQILATALQRGAFQSLCDLLESPFFADEWPEVRVRMCNVLLLMVLRYCDTLVYADHNLLPPAAQQANAWTLDSPPPASGNQLALVTSVIDSAPSREPRPDGPDTVMEALSSIFRCISEAEGGSGGGGEDADDAARAGAGPFSNPDLPSQAFDAFVNLVSFAGKAPPLLAAALDSNVGTDLPPGWGPPAFAAYLHLLRAYASGPRAALQILAQLVTHLQHDEYEHVSWNDYFRRLDILYHKYFNISAENRLAVVEQRQEPATASERTAIVAYTDLLTAIMSVLSAPHLAEDRASARHQLYQAYSTALPNHQTRTPEELLIEIMCLALPPDVKTAMDAYLAAFVSSLQEAVALLTRLADTAIVDSTQLLTQLKTVAEVEEDYSEMIGFVRLINTVLETAGPQLVTQEPGRLLSYTGFILQPLLCNIGMRRYSNLAQLYELSKLCTDHLILCIKHSSMSTSQPPLSLSTRPSLRDHILATLLCPGSTLLRELLTHVLGVSSHLQPEAVEVLISARSKSHVGVKAQDAMRSALALIVAVFDCDQAFVDAQRARDLIADPLDALLVAHPVWVLQLLQFVRYAPDAELQAAAVRIAGYLSSRSANFVHLLLHFPGHLERLKYDYALCFARSFGAGADGDGMALLLLRLLLDNAMRPFPNFTHLLLGYTVDQGPEMLASGPSDASCLGPLMDTLRRQAVPLDARATYCAAWHLAAVIVESRADGDALLYHLALSGVLHDALRSCIWAEASIEEVNEDAAADTFYCRAWILSVIAVLMITYDHNKTDMDLREAVIGLFQLLFSTDDGSTPSEALDQRVYGASIVTAALSDRALSAAWDIHAPAGFDANTVAELKAMGILKLLREGTAIDQGGVLVYDSLYGMWLYEGQVLKTRMKACYQAYNNKHDIREESHRSAAALNAAFEFAVQWNQCQVLTGARLKLMQALTSVVQLSCCEHFELCSTALTASSEEAPARPLLLFRSLITDCLERVLSLAHQHQRPPDSAAGLPTGGTGLVILILMQCAHSLLLEVGDRVSESHAKVSVQPPAFCKALMVGLLRIAHAVDEDDSLQNDKGAILSEVHACLLTHLNSSTQMSARTPGDTRNGSAPAATLPQLAEVAQANAEALMVEQLGLSLACSMRGLLDSSLLSGLREAEGVRKQTRKQFLQQLVHAVVALHTLAAVVAADLSAAVSSQLDRIGMLDLILTGLGEETEARLLAPPDARTASLKVVEAHLVFLLAFSTPDNPTQRATRCRELVGRGFFPALQQSRILQLLVLPAQQAEELAHLRTLALRIILTVAQQLSSNDDVLSETARLLISNERGTLGEHALNILRLALSPDASSLDITQAAHITTFTTLCLSKVATAASLSPTWQSRLYELQSQVLTLLAHGCTLIGSCMPAQSALDSAPLAIEGSAPSPSIAASKAYETRQAKAPAESREQSDAVVPVLNLLQHSVDLLCVAASPSHTDRLYLTASSFDDRILGQVRHFNVTHVMDMLSCLHSLQREVRNRSKPHTDPFASSRPARGAADPSLQACLAVVERCLAAVIMCLQLAMEWHQGEGKADASAPPRLTEAELQSLLQRCTALTEDWDIVDGSVQDASSLAVIDLVRAIKGCVGQLRDLSMKHQYIAQ